MRSLRISVVALLLIVGACLAVPTITWAVKCLQGTWIVQCPNGHRDQVDDITCNHDCESCGAKAVDGGTALVVCPSGHATKVTGVTAGHLCTFVFENGTMCGKQCRR